MTATTDLTDPTETTLTEAGYRVVWERAPRCELWLGDCADVVPLVKPACVLTDPPYGLGTRWTGGTWFRENVYQDDKVEWDGSAPQQLVDQLIALAVPTVIWGGNNFNLPPSRCWLAWIKNEAMPTMANFELAWTNLDRPAKYLRGNIHGWQRTHPTEKPVYLMRWCLKFLPEGSVADFFMGTGSAAVACIQDGRSFIGCEREEKYFTTALTRITEARAKLHGSLFWDGEQQERAQQLTLI